MVVSGKKSQERGSILFTSLFLLGILVLVMAALVNTTMQENRHTEHTLVWKKALPLAEAGVEEALAHINRNTVMTNDGWALNTTNATYFKQRNLADGHFFVEIFPTNSPIIRATGYAPAPLKNEFISRTVLVQTRQKRFGGIEVKDTIKGGSDGVIDSFDSEDPLYSTNGQYDPAKRKDNCHLVTISTANNKIDLGSRKVYGYVATGGSATVQLGSSGKVGSIQWIGRSDTGGKIEPGHWSGGYVTDFPPVPKPSFAGSGLKPLPQNYNGKPYAYLLGNGDYELTKLTLNSSQELGVVGKARLYIKDTFSLTASSAIIIFPGASLEVYCEGNNVQIAGRGFMNQSGNAKNLKLFGLPSNTQINLGGSADFIGRIYAPNANVKMAGTSTYIGHIKAESVDIGGGNAFHADESIAAKTLEIASWREIW